MNHNLSSQNFNNPNVCYGGSHTNKDGTTRLDSTVTNTTKPFKVFIKAVVTGDLIEFKYYSAGVTKNKSRDIYSYQLKTKKSDNRKEEFKKRRGSRAINTLKHKIINNFSDIRLVTLTFCNQNDFDITNPKICYQKLKLFLKRLKDKFGKFNYVCAVEFQKRGAVHYHLIYSLPFIDKEKIADIWKHGFVDIRYFPDSKIAAGYLAKYLIKQSKDKRFSNTKLFYTSKGLKLSPVYYNFPAIVLFKKVKSRGLTPKYSYECFNEWLGTIKCHEFIAPDLEIPFQPQDWE